MQSLHIIMDALGKSKKRYFENISLWGKIKKAPTVQKRYCMSDFAKHDVQKPQNVSTGQNTKSTTCMYLVSVHPSAGTTATTVLDRSSPYLEQNFLLTFWRKDFWAVQLEVVWMHKSQLPNCAVHNATYKRQIQDHLNEMDSYRTGTCVWRKEEDVKALDTVSHRTQPVTSLTASERTVLTAQWQSAGSLPLKTCDADKAISLLVTHNDATCFGPNSITSILLKACLKPGLWPGFEYKKRSSTRSVICSKPIVDVVSDTFCSKPGRRPAPTWFKAGFKQDKSDGIWT